MDSTSNYAKSTKTFHWDSPESAKSQYHEFLGCLTMGLGAKAWILSEEESASFLPVALPARPAANRGEDATDKWLKLEEKHYERNNKCTEAFFLGLSTVKSLITFNCRARGDLDSTISTRPVARGAKWGAMEQFRAVMKMLKDTYSASSATDIEALKRELAAMTDANGYYSYHSEFERGVAAIRSAGVEFGDGELTSWVKAGIRNHTVTTSFSINYYMNNPNATYKNILEKTSEWMQYAINTDNDPYKEATSARGRVGANAASTSTCRAELVLG
jgi:hypothetical protein